MLVPSSLEFLLKITLLLSQLGPITRLHAYRHQAKWMVSKHAAKHLLLKLHAKYGQLLTFLKVIVIKNWLTFLLDTRHMALYKYVLID